MLRCLLIKNFTPNTWFESSNGDRACRDKMRTVCSGSAKAIPYQLVSQSKSMNLGELFVPHRLCSRSKMAMLAATAKKLDSTCAEAVP